MYAISSASATCLDSRHMQLSSCSSDPFVCGSIVQSNQAGFHTGFFEKGGGGGGGGGGGSPPTYQETVPITNVLTARIATPFEQVHTFFLQKRCCVCFKTTFY